MTHSEWDLIVVGAGSAGAALAARSARRGKRVLLLEAGRDYRSAQMHEAWRSPNPVVALMDPTAVDGMVWNGLNSSRTDSQQQAPYWRGLGVGGSSSINGQIAIRPPMEDFDDWVALGCTGWSPDDVLPYFVRLEDDLEFGDTPYHGRGGPTPIYRAPQERWGGVDSALARSALGAGFTWSADVNAPSTTGVSPYPINSRQGRRVSVNDAYLEPARDLPELTIRGDALVDQVLFSGDQAIGVQYMADGAMHRSYADTTVLSAGSIHTPTILMRSGVGPADHLQSLGIEVRKDLPVGRGMQDHPMALVSLPLTAEAAVKSPDDRHTNVCVRWTSGPDAPVNDMMFVSLNQNVLSMATAETEASAGAFGVWLNLNYSRGDLALTAADPRAQPHVRQRMLSDERDRSRMREGIRSLASLACSDETGTILSGSVEEENAALFSALDNDQDLDNYLLSSVGDAQHGTSTCRMGAPDSPDTVVDPECRVLGLSELRVVDASIFPSVTRANTNLTASWSVSLWPTDLTTEHRTHPERSPMKTLQHLIDGAWQDSNSTTLLDVVDPATEQVVAHLPEGSPDDVDRAVAAAERAQPAWAALPVEERVNRIQAWAEAIAAHADELAALECQEMGKPTGIGRTFIDAAVAALTCSATDALHYRFEDTIDGPDGGRTRIIRHPLGVTAAITPWNFPVTMAVAPLGPLLAAGNTIVVKPSERSPLSTTRAFELLDLPPGVINLVLGDHHAGAPLAAHDRVQLVHFTGSVETGRAVAAEAGGRLHRTIAELGGKDPVIVDADVDPVATAEAVAFGAFVNSGQICTSMERIYVHRDVAEDFVDALVESAENFTVGDGRTEGVMVGPLVDERQHDIVRRHVEDAVSKGATVRTGGTSPDRVGYFYPPTVLTDVDASMLVMTEETFGPVAPVVIVDSFEEGLAHAADSRFGLAATLYTHNQEHMDAAAHRIPSGVIWINQWQGGGPERVYEPAGISGMGATGADAAYDAATRPASVHIAPSNPVATAKPPETDTAQDGVARP